MNNAMLDVTSGLLKGKSFPVSYREVTIGRHSSCKIRPAGYEQVSREHARLHWDGATFHIEDIGSKNGIVVNGKQTRSATLTNGDAVQLGDFAFQLRIPPGVIEFAETSKSQPQLVTKPFSVTAIAATCLVALVVMVSALNKIANDPSNKTEQHTTKSRVAQTTSDGGSGDTTGGSAESGGGSDKGSDKGSDTVSGGGSGSKDEKPTDKMLESVKNATVMIVYQVPGSQGSYSMGTGFVVEDGKSILTNRHVVATQDEHGENAIVQDCLVLFHCGTHNLQKVVVAAADINFAKASKDQTVNTDIAVLHLKEKLVEPISVGNTSELTETQRVWVVGFPHGMSIYTPGGQVPGPSVQEHNVERLQRDDQNEATMLQMGGSATHGNSGSAVINGKGEVVGVLEGGPGEGDSIKYAVTSVYIKRMLKAAKE